MGTCWSLLVSGCTSVLLPSAQRVVSWRAWRDWCLWTVKVRFHKLSWCHSSLRPHVFAKSRSARIWGHAHVISLPSVTECFSFGLVFFFLGCLLLSWLLLWLPVRCFILQSPQAVQTQCKAKPGMWGCGNVGEDYKDYKLHLFCSCIAFYTLKQHF